MINMAFCFLAFVSWKFPELRERERERRKLVGDRKETKEKEKRGGKNETNSISFI